MEHEMVVLEGKVFTVDLQSMLGSSAYGWCLSGLPKGIILEGIQTIPTAPGVAPVIQRFYFGVSSAEEIEAELTFALASSFQPSEVAKEHKISLTIIPCNSDKYVTHNETIRQKEADNTTNTAIPYGVLPPWEAAQAQIPYGVPYRTNYECGTNEPFMKYGYPCASQDALMKYGFPCGVQNSGMAYAYPSTGEPLMKYGFPCSVQGSGMAYAYPPAGCQDSLMKYGFPCNTQTTPGNEPFIVKYGYPCC